MNKKTKKAFNTLDIYELENEIAFVETDAREEEQYNADNAYGALDKQLAQLEATIPYPEITEYTTSGDYDEIATIQFKKAKQKSHREKCKSQRQYCDNGELYCGHLIYNSGDEFYIMDDSSLRTRSLDEKSSIMLVNVDDEKCTDITNAWRYPKNNGVALSRNVTMSNRQVIDVDVVLDVNNEMFSNITDAYLRKALVRNIKNSNNSPQNNIHSIIQTIQEKQDNIKALNINDSFIVQGCAGSGKTMVLLHRLRYLIYNEYLRSGQYLLLVPSNRFKNFIKNISTDFKISEGNIYSYMSYYQSLCGKGKELIEDNNDELVFSSKFLEKIYSNEFYIAAYQKFFNELRYQVGCVIEYSEERLNVIINQETDATNKEIESIIEKSISEITDAISILNEHLTNSVSNIEDIPLIIEEVKKIYLENKEKKECIILSENEIQISQDDERIVNNSLLNELKNEIEKEEEYVKKANIFTIRAHQNKFEKLKEHYEKEYEIVKQLIIEEEKKIISKKIANMKYVYEGITLEDIDKILNVITEIYEDANEKLINAKQKKENIDVLISEKYNEGISALNGLIEESLSIGEYGEKVISALIPASEYIGSIVKLGMTLVKSFKEDTNEDDKKRDKFKLFNERTENQSQAYISTFLFNVCKKALKDEYDVTICKLYKHYWFINLYCQYLTRPLSGEKFSYIYIDEGQDLSRAEIELISKINSIDYTSGEPTQYPVLNIFGDVNQTITSYGISNWKSIDFISKEYALNENFRNPNQIVEYCNEVLPFKMDKIGVDMEEVEHYKSFDDAMNILTRKKGLVYIVKDEYAKKDIQLELKNRKLEDDLIYTVKESKGLEFKEIIVVNRDMTDNEKYIAYTRALVKLTIIEELGSYIDKKEKLYLQGDDEEEQELK